MYRRLLTDPPDNIVEAWRISVEERGAMIQDGLDKLEEETGYRISHSRLGEWQRGKRVVPSRVQVVMAVQAAPSLLRRLGLAVSEADAQAIARALSPKVVD